MQSSKCRIIAVLFFRGTALFCKKLMRIIRYRIIFGGINMEKENKTSETMMRDAVTAFIDSYIDAVAREILEKYKEAFEELAK